MSVGNYVFLNRRAVVSAIKMFKSILFCDLKIKQDNYQNGWDECCKFGMRTLYFDDYANMESDLKALETWNDCMPKN